MPRNTAAMKSVPSKIEKNVNATATTMPTTSALETPPAAVRPRIRSLSNLTGRSGSEVLVGRRLRQLRRGQPLASTETRPRLVVLAEGHLELAVLDDHTRVAVVLVVVFGMA